MRPPRALPLSLLAALSLTPGLARADDPAAAFAELNQGYLLKEQKKCAEAMPHFVRSHQLDPSKPKPLLNLAVCEQDMGDLAAARGHFVQGRDLAATAHENELVAAADEEIAALDRKLPPAAGAAPPTSLPASTPTPQPEPPAGSPLPSGTSAGLGSSKLVALGLGGVGVAGLVVGVAEGLAASSKHATLDGECNVSAATCPTSAQSDVDAFHSARTVSAVGYVVGVLALGGGAALWFLAPGSQTATARLWVGPGSAGLAGRF